MSTRRTTTRGVTLLLVTVLALLAGAIAHAGHRHARQPRRCHRDAQCGGGDCNDVCTGGRT